MDENTKKEQNINQIKGEVLGGDFDKILMRVKSNQEIEIGEIVTIETKDTNSKDQNTIILAQVYDLSYSYQMSQQNLEMVSGLRLEDNLDTNLFNTSQRIYQIAILKPLLIIKKDQNNNHKAIPCKKLPEIFAKVKQIQADDISFMQTPKDALFLGNLRSGSKKINKDIFLPGKEVFSHHLLVAASTGKGKSNFLKCLVWDSTNKDYLGMLILDPHDEYYGRTELGLKNHPKTRQNVSYYTPTQPPPGAKTLIFNLCILKPNHFHGALQLSSPQRQLMLLYNKKFKQEWIPAIMKEERIQGASFHPDTVAVVKRKLMSLLNLDILDNNQITADGIFSTTAGENTISEITKELEQGKKVIIDTSFFSGAVEIMVGAMIATEMLSLYKKYKREGTLETKPVISIVLEEAPRVLGKKVLEQGSNVFDTLAREGRKFKIGLTAITQLPSEIPKTILANMNTKIILGIEMQPERQAIIESAAQDLKDQSKSIASLDKGEAIVTSTFTRFAIPISIPFYPNYVKEYKEKLKAEQIKELGENSQETQQGYVGF